MTCGEYVLDERLALAYRRLRDPRLAGRTVSSITHDAGFGDLSYFNRTFRRRYGVTPSGCPRADSWLTSITTRPGQVSQPHLNRVRPVPPL